MSSSYFVFNLFESVIVMIMNNVYQLYVLLVLFLACSLLGKADEKDGFVQIFNGKTLKGWRSAPETSYKPWSVKNGVIRGEGQEDRLIYLVYSDDESLKDFELKFQYKMVTKGNTGVEIRTRPDKTNKRPFEGYHADIGHVGIGAGVLGAWDFHFGSGTRREFPCPRGTRLVIDSAGEGKAEKIKNAVTIEDIKRHDWNQCRIVAKGNFFQLWINNKLASEFTDNIRKGQLEKGFIGLQLHDKGMVVEFKDIYLKTL